MKTVKYFSSIYKPAVRLINRTAAFPAVKKIMAVLKKYSAVIISALLVVLLIILFWQHILALFTGRVKLVPLDKDASVNILIGAITDKNKLTSLYLFSYEPTTRKIGIIYFPENTLLLQLSRSGKNRLFTIKELYDMGKWDYLKDSLENDFKIKIPYFLGISNKDFINIMDLLGGLNIDVGNEIKFFDRYDNRWYLLPPGVNELCGYKLNEYLEYDKDVFDEVNITYRKINFTKALFDKLNNMYMLENQENFLKNIYWLISKKNIGYSDFYDLLMAVKDVKPYDVTIDSASGQKERYKDKTGLRISITKAADILPKSFASKLDSVEKSDYITVEILNGTSYSGLGEKHRRILQEYDDVDVQFVGTARSKEGYPNTLIINKKGNLKSAQRIKELLNSGEIRNEPDNNSFVDITVIIGDDLSPK